MSNQVLRDEFVFRSERNNNGLLYLFGGLAFCGLGLLGMVVAIFKRVDQMALQAISTFPMMIGIMALLGGWRVMRTPTEVRVGPRGLMLVYRSKSRNYPWEEIGWAMTVRDLFRQRRMKIYHTSGRQIASITDSVEDFDDLIEFVDERIAARTDDAPRRIRVSKARRLGLGLGLFGAAMIAATIVVGLTTRDEMRGERLLSESAVEGEAEIVERFLAPNGVTPRLVYRVTNREGQSATRNAEMERLAWDDLEDAKTVPVIYAADDPSISHLVEGEVRDSNRQDLATHFLGCAFGAVFGLVCLGFAGLLFCGYGVDVDSKTGRVSIKPYGTGR